MAVILRKAIILGLLFGIATCGAATAGMKKRAAHPLRGVQKMVDPKSGKEVIFVWMQHMSSEQAYEQIRGYLDSMKAEGFVTFCESVVQVPFHIDTVGDVTIQQLAEMNHIFSEDDLLRLDTLTRKCRRMLEFMIGDEGYADPDNASLKMKNGDRGYVSQTAERLGLTTAKDIWVDYSLRDLVDVCERKYGEIPLTEYDWETGLYEKYTPQKRSSQRMRSYFKVFARNDYLVMRIAHSQHPKIVVVYGAGHSFGVIHFLNKNHGFRIDKSYKAE